MEAWVRELARDGRRPYSLPIGGSTGLGALGYVRAIRELAEQAGPSPLQIVLPVGSCGTLAGVLLGVQAYSPGTRVIGISVSRTSANIRAQTVTLMADAARILGLSSIPGEAAIEVYDSYHVGYGAFTQSAKDAIVATARLEGVLLDPVYTGKAMAGLMDLAARGIIARDVPTVFLHTGGLPIIFAYERDLQPLASLATI
jgi:1-aminocyclopropane-1-carboxylate deaminase/D-cysteine desulfhydrase-like pyridoxal-dependent ACC family enzyme